ncbi:MAG TPA: sigma-54-dependent Fis family transcriptional regulator, partial [Proteobacteria bacterium]|nr:sigma-54-dependent Fis family transcriptional regulator [Pseudomonadota bacterium]
REDIKPLAEYLLGQISQRLGGASLVLLPGAIKVLLGYPWPGNVRDLENLLERAAILSGSSELGEEQIVPLLTGVEDRFVDEDASDEQSIKKATRHLERRLIIRALQKTMYNRSKAARLLEISHRALLYKIKDYGIQIPK